MRSPPSTSIGRCGTWPTWRSGSPRAGRRRSERFTGRPSSRDGPRPGPHDLGRAAGGGPLSRALERRARRRVAGGPRGGAAKPGPVLRGAAALRGVAAALCRLRALPALARPIPARHGVLNAWYEAYGQWGGGRGGHGGRGSRAAPRIGILDWREVPTYSEFVLFAEYFRAHGLDVVIGDPREAELRNGAFLLGGAPVDLIYKRVLLAELMARGGCDHPVIRAVRSGAVCMVNPFRCKILHKKASLAVLSDERNAKLFSAAERRAIDAHVPWTRTVAEQKTLHGGRKVDLVPFILAQRDRLVLKPNDEYGGKGIVLGWEVDDAAWQRAVGAALAEPYVVQERVPIPSESFPSLVEGRVTYAGRILDTNPFACHGASR